MKQTLVSIIVGAAALVLPSGIFVFIFVSIVWTHRPDLSIVDIIVLAVREIGEIIMKAGRCSGRKDNREYENHHL